MEVFEFVRTREILGARIHDMNFVDKLSTNGSTFVSRVWSLATLGLNEEKPEIVDFCLEIFNLTEEEWENIHGATHGEWFDYSSMKGDHNANVETLVNVLNIVKIPAERKWKLLCILSKPCTI